MTPTDLEHRLRRDLAAEAARTQASMLSPLTEPERNARCGLSWRPAPRRAPRWLAPAAATAAMAAVVAGVTLAGSGLGGRPGPGATPGAALGFPRFYLSVNPGPHAHMVIHSSTTGRVLSSEPLPRLQKGEPDAMIAAAANDRRFAIAVTLHPARTPAEVALYTLIISKNGRAEVLQSNPRMALAGKDDVVTGIALSPDGRKLAVAVSADGRGSSQQGEIQVFEGSKLTGIWAGGPGVVKDPAWLAGGRYLGFLWWTHLRGALTIHTPRTRERLLDTAAPGHSLASSKLIAAGPGGAPLVTAVLSADGRTLLGTWYRNIPGTDGGAAVVSFGRVGLHGGRPAVIAHRVIRYRTSAQEDAADLSCEVQSVAGQNHAALLTCPSLERFQDGYSAALPSLGPTAVVTW